MKRKIITFICILLVLSMLVGMLVACEQVTPVDPIPDPPAPPDLPILPDDPESEEIAILFEPMGLYDSLSKYNGETGIGDDTYFAALKVKVATESGTANAAVVITAVNITFIEEGLPVERPATPEEFAKFSLETNRLSQITTEPREEMLRIKFGNFSDAKYYGAKFSFELQATAMSIVK